MLGGVCSSDRTAAELRPACTASTAYTGASTAGGAPPSSTEVSVTRPTTCHDPSGRRRETL